MPVEITMPQLSDTMTEGTVVKWNKKEGDAVKAGEEIADVETDKAVMPMEAFEGGTLAVIVAKEGSKVPVGGVLAVIAGKEDDLGAIRKKYGGGGAVASAGGGEKKPEATKQQEEPKKPEAAKPLAASRTENASTRKPPEPAPSAKPAAPKESYQYDLIVIGGGPAGYAAAIRAGQLKKKVLCVEKENLGGTCLNWGCIPTKALLEDGAFIRKLRTDAKAHGVSFSDLKVDFAAIIGRSRGIADKLARGIGSLFKKYTVQHEQGTGQLLGAHKVKITESNGSKELTADHIILAVGARTTAIPGVTFDGTHIITSREAMNLPKQPRRLAIIGAGAIGCEFADFYNAVGTEVSIIEMLPHLLPNEDDDVAAVLERSFLKRGIKSFTKTKVEKIEKKGNVVTLNLSGEKNQAIEADAVLVAVGVTPNTEGLATPQANLQMEKTRIKVDPQYKTNVENVWAIGDCISMHWPVQEGMGGYRHPDLAHVAHHEAVYCVERIFGHSDHTVDYKNIPGCTYTHPQVASMGRSEQKLKAENREIKVGKFPFIASGRALAAGESDGFVKLIFDAKYGELLGVHMVGENVTELLAELVLARKLEATEAEIIEAMHPHPTMSEAVMEAAGVADGRAIHL